MSSEPTNLVAMARISNAKSTHIFTLGAISIFGKECSAAVGPWAAHRSVGRPIVFWIGAKRSWVGPTRMMDLWRALRLPASISSTHLHLNLLRHTLIVRFRYLFHPSHHFVGLGNWGLVGWLVLASGIQIQSQYILLGFSGTGEERRTDRRERSPISCAHF